jgi:predicted GH43/DUF377 family glycosyl hydrolase
LDREQAERIDMLFEQTLQEASVMFKDYRNTDLVIGIPFYNEKEILVQVLENVEKALPKITDYKHPLIVCAGDPRGADLIEIIRSMAFSVPHCEFIMKPGTNGRGSSIRALMEIAKRLEADLLILAADVKSQGKRGFSSDWVPRILAPLNYGYDCVLTTFVRNPAEDVTISFLVKPLIELFYNFRLDSSISGIYAFSHDVVEDLCLEIKFWLKETRGYGIDPWLLTRIIRWNKRICQVSLGSKLDQSSMDKVNYVFKEMARAIFECIKRDEEYWLNRKMIVRAPDLFGGPYEDMPGDQIYCTREMVTLFKRSFHQYRSVFENTIKPSLFSDVERIVLTPSHDFRFSSQVWADTVLSLLFKYWFASTSNRDDILNALTFSFNGRVAGFLNQLETLEDMVQEIRGLDSDRLINIEANITKQEQLSCYLQWKDSFTAQWKKKALETKPPIIPAHFLEYIPGIPIVLPKVLKGRGGRTVHSEELFNRLQERYQKAFRNFVYGYLKVPEDADLNQVSEAFQQFLQELEETMDILFPGNLHSEEGIDQVLSNIFRLFPHTRVFSIKDDIFKEALRRFPPINVMIPAGFKSIKEMLNNMDARNAVSMANLVETRKYADRMLLWILENLKPEEMEEVEVKYIVLDELSRGIAKIGNISDLNKLTTRMVVRPINKGMGGDFPKLRFCLFIARHIMIAQNYGRMWRIYARERKNLGNKIRNSLIGRYEATAFSAHNILENWHHRLMIEQFKVLAQQLEEAGRLKEAEMINAMCDSYGLSQIMADGTFMPLSAWSWSSYSYKGGSGVPTPLSCHVEEKWFNHDLLEDIYRDLGYNAEEIQSNVIQLVGEGRASENLLDTLLGIRSKDVKVVPREGIDYPPAGPLIRDKNNPLLNPIPEHYWESKYVLNAAAVRIDGKVYILYRAFGDDEISRIGMAVTDGYNVLERLEDPIFIPQDEKESRGCEDPRVVIIDDELYMMYTAYNGVIAQISAASIKIDDFLNRRWDKWVRKGFAFEDIWNKDAILFPEKIKGRYCIYHRIEPSIWVSYMDKLEFPVPKEKHSIILGPRSGMMWDSLKIGAGSQPIKTKYGWLMIYHGVDRNRVYRLGVFLVDLENPELLLYQSPNPILSPETEYEIGKEGAWVPNVVFTCGAVSDEDKEVLDANDKVLVYYGAADTYLCLATATVGELIPEEIRREIEFRR